jgi:hypothetical protein
MAKPWLATQYRNGGFPDPLNPEISRTERAQSTRYGDSVMGVALIQTGLREGSRRMVTGGVRAINRSVKRMPRHSRPSAFEQYAVALAYNLMLEQAPWIPAFRRHQREWETALRALRTKLLGHSIRYNNHFLVEANAVAELLRTRLRSRDPRSILGGGRGRARSELRRLVNRRVPAYVARGRGPKLISDKPDEPLAYQALSVGFYAPLVRDYGGPRARRTLGLAVQASCRVQSPGGQLAYAGRSQELVWVPAATVLGATVAAKLSGTGCARSLASTSARYLRDAYPVRRSGQVVVPILAHTRIPFARLDGYVGGPSMDGLALLFLNLAIDAGGGEQPRARAVAPTSHVLGRGAGQIATVRTHSMWYAVRLRPAESRLWWRDLRYTAGLVGAERLVRGRWEPTMSLPRTDSGLASAAPTLLVQGRWATFSGTRVSIRGGVATLRGGFRIGRGPGRLVRRATVKYRPAGSRILVSVGVRRGDRVRFTRLDSQPAPPARAKLYHGLASATARVRRTSRTVTARRPGWLTAPAA